MKRQMTLGEFVGTVVVLSLLAVVAFEMFSTYSYAGEAPKPTAVYHRASFNAGIVYALLAMDELWLVSESTPSMKKMPPMRMMKVIAFTAEELAKEKGAIVVEFKQPPVPTKPKVVVAPVVTKPEEVQDEPEVVDPLLDVDAPTAEKLEEVQ